MGRLLIFVLSLVLPTGGTLSQTLTITGVGDIMLGTDYPDDRLPVNDGAHFLELVNPILRAADITFGNLEGVIMAGGIPQKTCSTPDVCFLFRSPPRYTAYLRDAGFDVLSLANNHTRDFGEEGRTASMAVLDQYSLRHSGRRGDIAMWKQNDLTIAFIAFSPTQKSYLLNDIPTAKQEILRLSSTHDIVVVSFHGGAEGPTATNLPFEEEFYFGETRGEVVRFSHAAVDAGADLVLGHGPHVPRALELYNGRLIAYSLGNFITHVGVSISGITGWAPILTVRIDQEGAFLSGRIDSALQSRVNGLVWDPDRQAYKLIRDLTEKTFGTTMLRFEANGTFIAGEIDHLTADD